jgi:RNA polymerase sigma-70 factor, ECF subfamily
MPYEYGKHSDEALIKAVIRGDNQAYGELYNRYFNEVFRYVYYRAASNQLDAEDMTQVVFFRAWDVLLKKQPQKYNFRALVYRIAQNLSIDRWRTQKQETSLDETVDNKAQVNASEPSPDQLTLRNEESQKLAAAIRELEPNLQNVIICRFINGLSHAETADALGLTEGNVRVLQHRALKRIRIAIT